MSGYQEDSLSASSLPYSGQPIPMHAGMYASDLEHQAMEAAAYTHPVTTYSYDHTVAAEMIHPSSNNSYYAYGHAPYYQDSHGGHVLPPQFPSGSGYVPGLPIHHSEPQGMDSFPQDMTYNENTTDAAQDFPSASGHSHYHNDPRNRGKMRGQSRGNSNSGRGYNKRGGFKNHNSHGRDLEFTNGYDYNNHYPSYRGNPRGHRGYQGVSFHNRNKHYDNNQDKQWDNYYPGDQQYNYRSNMRDGKEPKHPSSKNGYRKDVPNERVKTSNASGRPGSNHDNMNSLDENVSPQNSPDSSLPRKSGTGASSTRGKGRDPRGGIAANKLESKTLSEQKKNYDSKGARPKYMGRRWDPQTTEDKDESQRGSLTEQLSRNAYECMVCCEIIKVESAVWSCQSCYHVFHLHCTKKWAHSSVDKDTKIWRCPGCQNESTFFPSQYRCFCGKRKDPAYIRGETPHSCGEACRKKRKENCKHPCTILCHPGPCPPCSSMVNQPCDCGRERKSMRCSVAAPFKCDKICDKFLSCGKHKCEDRCHTGDCQPCTVSKMQGCYCGRCERSVLCGTAESEMISYSCEEPCGKTLTCGNHVCEVACHPGECAPCSSDPAVLTTCCCGKTSLETLNAPTRQSCLDPIPVCESICSKPLVCGTQYNRHLCKKQCHEGDCGPCNRKTSVSCQCGRLKKDFPCETAVKHRENNSFKCQKKCGKMMNCKQHKCTDNCCVKDYHICEKICGAKLSCGVHKCKDLCHSGGCTRCLRTSFDELACFCGATVIEPPIPCGTKPPECRQLCTRPQKCGHPIRHNCHMEDECPLCTELTEKTCMGGHIVRKNIPCHMKNISCGMPCDKQLPCGIHRCQKVCHKGPCLSEGAVCIMACTKPRPACGHPCAAPCHKGGCPSTVCKAEVVVTCSCGNRTTKIECLMGDHAVEIAQFQRLSVQSIAEASGGEGVDMAQFDQTKTGSRKLDCDDSCAILERNKRFAEALGIKNPDLSGKPGSPTFTDFLKECAKKNPAFAASVEKALGNLVQTAKKSLHQNRSHSFPSMNRDQRRFVHELAEFYGCQTQSYDFEPNKNVVATAYREKCRLPSLSLTQFLSKVQVQAPPPLSGLKSQGITFTVLGGEKKKHPSSGEEPSSIWKTVSYGKPGSSTRPSQPKVPSDESPKAAAPTLDYFDFTEN